MQYFPYEMWCEISHHISSGDCETLFNFRLICRDSNAAVNKLLKETRQITAYGVGITTTINNIRHGPIAFDIRSRQYKACTMYYYGQRHGPDFLKIGNLDADGFITITYNYYYKNFIRSALTIKIKDDCRIIYESYRQRIQCIPYFNKINETFAITTGLKKIGNLFTPAGDDDDDIHYFIIAVPDINF